MSYQADFVFDQDDSTIYFYKKDTKSIFYIISGKQINMNGYDFWIEHIRKKSWAEEVDLKKFREAMDICNEWYIYNKKYEMEKQARKVEDGEAKKISRQILCDIASFRDLVRSVDFDCDNFEDVKFNCNQIRGIAEVIQRMLASISRPKNRP